MFLGFFLISDVPFERSFKLFLFLFFRHPTDILVEKIRKPKDKITLALSVASQLSLIITNHKMILTQIIFKNMIFFKGNGGLLLHGSVC